MVLSLQAKLLGAVAAFEFCMQTGRVGGERGKNSNWKQFALMRRRCAPTPARGNRLILLSPSLILIGREFNSPAPPHGPICLFSDAPAALIFNISQCQFELCYVRFPAVCVDALHYGFVFEREKKSVQNMFVSVCVSALFSLSRSHTRTIQAAEAQTWNEFFRD